MLIIIARFAGKNWAKMKKQRQIWKKQDNYRKIFKKIVNPYSKSFIALNMLGKFLFAQQIFIYVKTKVLLKLIEKDFAYTLKQIIKSLAKNLKFASRAKTSKPFFADTNLVAVNSQIFLKNSLRHTHTFFNFKIS